MKIVTECPLSLITKSSGKVTGANQYSCQVLTSLLNNPEIECLVLTDAEPSHYETLKKGLSVKTDTEIAFTDFFNFKADLIAFQPDAYVVTDLNAKRFLFARNYLAEAIPVIGMVHLCGTRRSSQDLVSFFDQALPYDSLICPTEAIKTTIEKCYDQNTKEEVPFTLEVIPHGVDCHRFKPLSSHDELKKKLNIDTTKPIILTIERLNPFTKGDVVSLLRQIEQLKDEGILFQYVIVGEPHHDSYRSFLENYVKENNLSECVKWVMDPDPARIHEYYQCADIYVSIADNPAESFGLTVAEAMATQLPVILNNVAFYAHHIEDGVEGFLIPTYGSDQHDIDFDFYAGSVASYGFASMQHIAMNNDVFREKIKILLKEDKKRIEMGESAIKKAKKEFDFKVAMTRYIALIERQISLAKTSEKPLNQMINISEVLSHIPEQLLDDETVLTLSDYGRNVLEGKKSFKALERYLNNIDRIQDILKRVHTETVSIKHLKVQTTWTDSDLHEVILFLLKQDLVKII